MSGAIQNINDFVSSSTKGLKGPKVAAITAFVFFISFLLSVLSFVLLLLSAILLFPTPPDLLLDVNGLMLEYGFATEVTNRPSTTTVLNLCGKIEPRATNGTLSSISSVYLVF